MLRPNTYIYNIQVCENGLFPWSSHTLGETHNPTIWAREAERAGKFKLRVDAGKWIDCQIAKVNEEAENHFA